MIFGFQNYIFCFNILYILSIFVFVSGCKVTTFSARLLSIMDNNSFFALFLAFFDHNHFCPQHPKVIFVALANSRIVNSQIVRWAILSIAFSVCSGDANAENRTYPSPCLPKPTPGVQTTWHSFSSMSKNAHESILRGALTHTYGPSVPP